MTGLDERLPLARSCRLYGEATSDIRGADLGDDWFRDVPAQLPEPPPGGSADDYPFDPSITAAQAEAFDGLDRLRTMSDRELAQASYELYWATSRRGRR